MHKSDSRITRLLRLCIYIFMLEKIYKIANTAVYLCANVIQLIFVNNK